MNSLPVYLQKFPKTYFAFILQVTEKIIGGIFVQILDY